MMWMQHWPCKKKHIQADVLLFSECQHYGVRDRGIHRKHHAKAERSAVMAIVTSTSLHRSTAINAGIAVRKADQNDTAFTS